MLKKFFVVRKEEGASAIEYALIAGLVAVVIAIGAGLLGTGLNEFFTRLADEVGTYLI